VNRNDDVRVVQALLNDWRARKNLRPIAVDGSAGPETRGAITAFQQQATGLVDGRVDPHGPAMRVLEDSYAAPMLRETATAILEAFAQIDPLIAQREIPYTIAQSLLGLRRDAALLLDQTAPVAALPRHFSFASRSPVIGFVGVDDATLALLFALIALILLIMSTPAFQRAVRELGKIPEKVRILLNEVIEKAAEIALHLSEEVNDLNRRFDRCMERAVKTPACLVAIAKFQALATAVEATMGTLMSVLADLASKNAGPVDVVLVQSLVAKLKSQVAQMEAALEEVLNLCGCRDAPPTPGPVN
jgi:peptidoglycan hydrolase-like protein with peptidoglycan-binding domain